MGHTIYPIWFYAQNKDLIMPSTTKEIIEVTQINMQKARHAQIEMLNKLNKSKNPRAQRLINLEIPVLVRSLKSSNVELG